MQTNVSTQWIGFRNKLVRTHVSPYFKLRIPKEFFDVHLPRRDVNITLVDENEQEYVGRYCPKDNTLTRGWGGFVIAHGLLEGDTVVFDMIDVCVFKVHIIRSSKSKENEFQNNKPVDLVKLKELIDESECIGNTTTHKKDPVFCVVDSDQKEVVPKETVNHARLALLPQYINFCKILHQIHVSKGCLRLPMEFCRAHLPCHNTTITLVDVNRREYSVAYWVKEGRLLRGWKAFVRAHGLQEGDTLVFHMIGPCRFKVYISSAKRTTRTNGAGNGQIHQVTRAGTQYPVKPSLTVNRKKRSTETYLVSPKEKIQRKMSRVVKLQCGNILRDLMMHSHGWIFSQPVDPVRLNIPDYFSVISEPMDLGTIKHKLDGDRYSSMEGFAADVRLTFSNAMWYNPPEHDVHKWAKLFSGFFTKKRKSVEDKLKVQETTAGNSEDQDSRELGWKKYQATKKEWKIGDHVRAGKVFSPEKMVKHRSQISANNVEKDLSSAKSSKQDVCGDSKVNFRTNSVIKKKMHEQVHTMSSPETDGADKSYPSFYDSSNEYGHENIVKKEPLTHNVHDTTMLVSDCDSTPRVDKSGSVEYSGTDLNFNDVKGFKDFMIQVNGEILDPEIPPEIRMKYYQLCCGQKMYIHEHVIKGLNSKLVVAMISEIVRIADDTQTASISTSTHDLERMRTTLKSFQDLGMEVGSLRAKIGMLIKFSSEHRMIEGLPKLAETERGRTFFQEKSSIGSSFTHGVSIGHLENKVHAMKEKREKLRFVFKNVAGLTW